jgi:hypothetical protein
MPGDEEKPQITHPSNADVPSQGRRTVPDDVFFGSLPRQNSNATSGPLRITPSSGFERLLANNPQLSAQLAPTTDKSTSPPPSPGGNAMPPIE